MRILLTSSEAVPFSKTGGLSDVAAALTKELANAGHDVALIIPSFPQSQARLASSGPSIEPTGKNVEVRLRSRQIVGRILKSSLPGSNAAVYLIDQPNYFDRAGLYLENGRDYSDNCERFVFFSRAVLEAARVLGLRPDVIHANDWQTGLVPALLSVEYGHQPEFEQTGSTFTVHNMAFQGQFWHWDMLLTGLDWQYFNWKQMEYYNHLNLLKTGIVFADMITTVSPTYAREIQTPRFGYGLENVLSSRRDVLRGILNGIDVDEWNPRTDPRLARNYSVDALDGKANCKTQLQQQLNLPVRPETPLFGMISRMTDQKGFGLLVECLPSILERDVQVAFLGTGEKKYENWAQSLAAQFPGKVSATIGFDDTLAHRIEAGSDLFLMPSLFEPCGLNQMYSMTYGTVPIVRAVGGLADTIIDATVENLADGSATGFSFDIESGAELGRTIERALQLYADRDAWKLLVESGMRKDWSWSRSAKEYVDVYQSAIARRTRRAPAAALA
ncbi:MAG: glycogen synthase GlgA [Planctomycetaceae bacterium]